MKRDINFQPLKTKLHNQFGWSDEEYHHYSQKCSDLLMKAADEDLSPLGLASEICEHWTDTELVFAATMHIIIVAGKATGVLESKQVKDKITIVHFIF